MVCVCLPIDYSRGALTHPTKAVQQFGDANDEHNGKTSMNEGRGRHQNFSNEHQLHHEWRAGSRSNLAPQQGHLAPQQGIAPLEPHRAVCNQHGNQTYGNTTTYTMVCVCLPIDG
jgi:hypothetical protein